MNSHENPMNSNENETFPFQAGGAGSRPWSAGAGMASGVCARRTLVAFGPIFSSRITTTRWLWDYNGWYPIIILIYMFPRWWWYYIRWWWDYIRWFWDLQLFQVGVSINGGTPIAGWLGMERWLCDYIRRVWDYIRFTIFPGEWFWDCDHGSISHNLGP